MRMEVQSRLMQARFIEIQQVFEKKKKPRILFQQSGMWRAESGFSGFPRYPGVGCRGSGIPRKIKQNRKKVLTPTGGCPSERLKKRFNNTLALLIVLHS